MSHDELDHQRNTLQQLMVFLGALAHGSETILGPSTHSMGYMAGKRFALEALQDAETTEDVLQGLEFVKRSLKALGIVWEFRAWKRKDETSFVQEGEDGRNKIRLVFYDCMIRNTLFRYAHSQKESLCYMSHGCFVGAMEKVIPGVTFDLEIIHAGPNACLKEMTFGKGR